MSSARYIEGAGVWPGGRSAVACSTLPLKAGARLGPYEVVGPLGAGGMGEVYRAADTRLGRQVAVKVLPEHLARDEEALARLEREARAVAGLSHPGICTLHDVGHEGAVSYLVMELLEGETLAERLTRGPLPLDQVFRLGAEIGGALAAAHERGIAHRDLKPGNVMLTRAGVKLLDFGLARALEPTGGQAAPAATASVNLTQEGTLLGTLPYMAPEQLEGRRADHRSDIFALGAVLYEMATGQRAFSGRSQASLISAILSSQPPPISSFRPLSPPGLDQLVRTCLAKEPDQRWQSARDVVLQLRALAEAPPAVAASGAGAARRTWLGWGVAVLAVALWLGSSLRGPTGGRPGARTVSFQLRPPPGGEFSSWAEAGSIAVSPDGSMLAYSAREGQGQSRLWLRPVSSIEARPLPGSEGGAAPFWSPDGRSLGFSAGGKLRRLDLAGGAPMTLCDVPPGGGVAGTWGRDGILFVVSPAESSVLYRVPAGGGTPSAVITAEPAKGERRLAWPAFLPDGERFLYALRHTDYSWHLMLAGPGTAPRELAAIASSAQMVGPQHLAFVREGTLLVQRFDWRAGRLAGETTAVANPVRYFLTTGNAAFSASLTGTLVFQPADDVNQLAWFDRSGRQLGSVGPPGNHLSVALAPDGSRVLYERARPATGTWDVWSADLALQAESRLTSHPETEVRPRWLGAGAIMYSANLQGLAPQLVRRNLATGHEDELLPRAGFRWAEDVSPDGSTLVYAERGQEGTTDLWALSLSGSPAPRLLLRSPFSESGARFSPDGRSLAFVSNESGRQEAYVMPYPGPGEKRPVSTGGAVFVRWGRDGRELFLLSPDGQMWSLPVGSAPTFLAGPPRRLFALAGRRWIDFEVAPDGGRFLALVPQVVGNEQPATVIVGWSPQAAP